MNQSTNSYLTFEVNDNAFGIHVEKVVEIKEYSEPKSIPESMPYVKGIIEYLDEVIPLIDAATKFNLGEIAVGPYTHIIILEIINEQKNSNSKIGVIVDAVSDVFEADPKQFKDLENDYRPKYISSTYKSGDTFIMMLDSNKIFSEKDIIALDKIIKKLK